MKKKLVKKNIKTKRKSINLLMATCLGKQLEVGKGHGQVGGQAVGGPINFLEEASSLKKKGH